MTYRVKRGDTLSKIAKTHGVTLAALLDVNPQYKANPNRLQVGNELTVPGEEPSTAPPPETSVADEFLVPYGQLTFDAEGLETRGRYFSRIAHVPGPSSGVTLGRGYDMREKSKRKILTDLLAAGIEEAVAKTFAEASGLTGNEARRFIQENRLQKVEITPQQQRRLFLLTYQELEKDVIRICNKADVTRKYGVFVWEALHPTIKGVVVDLRYRGDYTGITRAVMQKSVVENDLIAFTRAMSDRPYWVQRRGVPRDRFERRVAFLQRATVAVRQLPIGDYR